MMEIALQDLGPDFSVAIILFCSGVVTRLTIGTVAWRNCSITITSDKGILASLTPLTPHLTLQAAKDLTKPRPITSRDEDGIKQLTDDIQERRDWMSTDLVDVDTLELGAKPLRVLDYACGTRLVSHMFAYYGNLMKVEGPADFDGPEFFDFDLVFVGLGFHHFDNPALASQRLVRRLKSSGKIVIIDNLAPDHTGFSKESVQKLFEDAGAGQDNDFSVLSRPLKIGRGPQACEQQVFIAKGTKP
ncbi:hypothetical protein V495_02924 [Pseudogymnoascus sp. VKM F-4514 (FW-929)]|nr:hypothetical protein V495_02924 [Pseudogymnoascus sp. VKM F-4514 (FW-929)]KFY61158.1 hypothetical protein V497_03104 [Pseudogymnoascus sp. VKM F-4516 (FW-969)]